MNIAAQQSYNDINTNDYYKELRNKAGRINIEIIKCIGNDNTEHLTRTLELVKDFLNGVQDKENYIFLRISDLLHSVLITRMTYNLKFKSPLYDEYIQDQRKLTTTESCKIVIASYIEAIERSMDFSVLEQ